MESQIADVGVESEEGGDDHPLVEILSDVHEFFLLSDVEYVVLVYSTPLHAELVVEPMHGHSFVAQKRTQKLAVLNTELLLAHVKYLLNLPDNFENSQVKTRHVRGRVLFNQQLHYFRPLCVPKNVLLPFELS